MKFNPYAAQIKFTQTVNKAIHQFHVEIPVYRTIEGKVQKCPIRMMRVNLENGNIEVEYEVSKQDDWGVFEKATKQDLALITQFARQMAAAHR